MFPMTFEIDIIKSHFFVSVHSAVLSDMMAKMQQNQRVALVHQMPFVSDQPGLSAAVEKVSIRK